jgi:tetratricopeptide (TPR) repeat protein
MKANKLLWVSVLTLLGFLIGKYEVGYALSVDQAQRLKVIENQFYNGSRTNKELEQMLKDLDALHKEEKKDSRINLLYAYALYYKAAYILPQEGSLGAARYLKQKIEIYEKAKDIIEDGIDNLPSGDDTLSAKSYLTKGLILGQVAGLSNSAIRIIQSRKALEKALSIKPEVENGAIYIALGRMYSKVPTFLFGSSEKSLKYLRIAEKDFPSPTIVLFLYEAETLIGKKTWATLSVSEKQEVKRVLNVGLRIAKMKKRITPEEADALKIIKQYLRNFH